MADPNDVINMLPAVNIGDVVQLIGGEKGSVVDKSTNLGFPTYEILLQSGKIVTEARYRFDVMQTGESLPIARSDRSTSQKNDICSINSTGPLAQNALDTNSFITPNVHVEMSNESDTELLNVDIDQFIIEEQNKNTQKKTHSDVNKVREFFHKSLNENREIETIPPNELCKLLCLFFMNVKTNDGKEYEPSSIRGIACSVYRHLKLKDYGCQIATSVEFSKVNEIIKTKQKRLKREGKGNMEKRAEALTDDDVDKLFNSKQLGDDNPESLLRTLWFYNTVHFGMRSVTEHRDMKWGDVRLFIDSDGREYIEHSERQTKTRPGSNPRNVRSVPPRAWATPENPSRCPIALYKLYSDRRPATFSNNDDPFYIATNTNPNKSARWFKSQAVGVNKLGKFMPTMAKNAGLLGSTESTGKRITNHSARKYMVQKLNDKGLPPNQMMQISGHKNIQSVNSYSTLNTNQQRTISDILSNRQSENTCAPTSSRPPKEMTFCNHSSTLSQNLTKQKTVVALSGVNTQSPLFSGPVYGGTFNITVNHAVQRKRPRVVYSDDDSN